MFFLDEDKRNTAKGSNSVFPICKFVGGKTQYEKVGTGFFISRAGLFATATHVVMGKDRNPEDGLFALYLALPSQEIRHAIRWVSVNFRDDVAVGYIEPPTHPETGKKLLFRAAKLTGVVPQVGEKIASVAFPQEAIKVKEELGSLSFFTKFYTGKVIEEHREGRGGGRYPGKCYRTDLNFGGGASGGPTYNQRGRVFAINSFTLFPQGDSYIYHIQSIGGLPTLKYITTQGEPVEGVKIKDLIESGEIIAD